MSDLFREVEFFQLHKWTEIAYGDTFLCQKDRETGRIISVLSDGLGSGVKANVLASMTATMALKFAQSELDMVRSAEIMMTALPVCAVRRIGYATYTVVDCHDARTIKIVEQGNPRFIYIRNGEVLDVPAKEMTGSKKDYRRLHFSEITPQAEDRILFFTDGVTEAGMGSPMSKLGWRRSGVIEFVRETLRTEFDISARELAKRIVRAAASKEPGGLAGDDISCAAIYMRTPHRTLLLSGPPYDDGRDAEFARLIEHFEGAKAICGGTSSEIVSRELQRPLNTPITRDRGGFPPASIMEGVNLVTEGILTLTETQRILEHRETPHKKHAAARLAELLRESDVIEMVVGTRINEAHQDPNLPVGLEIRRNLLKRMKSTLEDEYLKEVTIRYI